MDNQMAQVINQFYGMLRRNAGYLARQEMERLLTPLREDPKRLEPHGFKVYSQNEEDGILEEIFRRLDISNGLFCEIGVENGLECNTLYLIHKGWRGCWVEGNAKQREPIEQKFKSILDSGRLVLAIGFITAENINPVFSQIGFQGRELDLVSIDVDGNDIHLFEALNQTPKVFCIEYNSKFPPPLSKKTVYDKANTYKGGDYMGASLTALNEAARSKGYTLVATNLTGCNAFFVRDDLVGDKFVADPTPEKLYHPPRYWLTFDHFYSIGHPADFGLYTDLQ